MCVCVCVCVCVRERESVCVCVCVCASLPRVFFFQWQKNGICHVRLNSPVACVVRWNAMYSSFFISAFVS